MPKLCEINEKSEEFMKAVNDFVSHPRGFLLLAGSNGNGKSFTARAIMDHFTTPRLEHQFWNQVDLKMRWEQEYQENGHANTLCQEILKAPLLVLDDVRRPSHAFGDFLYWVSEKRFEMSYMAATIVTTNLNSEGMREAMGDAFVSRVSSGICIRWDGPDRRSNKF